MPNKILGIDPGFGRLGLAIIESDRGNQKLVYSKCFETDTGLPHPKRLLLIGEKVRSVIAKYRPAQVATETLLWSKNKKTALQVAEARGVILLEAERGGCRIREFNPNQIKLAVTGYGKSDKKQMMSMIDKLIKLEPKKRHDDEYDAIAVAITSAVTTLSTDLT